MSFPNSFFALDGIVSTCTFPGRVSTSRQISLLVLQLFLPRDSSEAVDLTPDFPPLRALSAAPCGLCPWSREHTWRVLGRRAGRSWGQESLRPAEQRDVGDA